MIARAVIPAILATAAIGFVDTPSASAQGCIPSADPTDPCFIGPDPPPPPPPCDLDAPPDRVQGPCQTAKFEFVAVDPTRDPADNVVRCEVTLDGASPPDSFGEPKIQWRSSINCDDSIRRIQMQAHLYRGPAPPLGYMASGPWRDCYDCYTIAPSRGDDYFGAGAGEYTIRAYLALIAPGSTEDPWIASEGLPTDPENDPAGCAPGDDRVYCYVDLRITAAP